MPPPSAWSPPRAKVQLKLAIQRLRLLAQKKTQLAKATRREIAQQLEKGRIESASIKCEGIMSEDLYVELLEVLELYCELLLARFGLLETVKEIDPGVNEAVAGIIHAAPRTELKELHVLREMLMSKGGRDYSIACVDNVDGIVPDRVTAKLVVSAPPQELIDLYLYEIAKAYSVDWRPQGFPDPNAPASAVPTATVIPSTTTSATASHPPATPTKAPTIPPFDSTSLSTVPSTPPVDPAKARDTVVLKASLPSPGLVPPPAAKVTPPPTTMGQSQAKKDEDAFVALSKRFAELKRR
ncbi:hypothetical protein JCM1841_006823 [Sporobolomyces salmonicolor]